MLLTLLTPDDIFENHRDGCMIGAVFEAKKEIPGKGVSASTRRAPLSSTLDRPEMNSVRDACRGCKTGKPVFLLFRLVESTLEGAAEPNSSQSCSVTVYDHRRSMR